MSWRAKRERTVRLSDADMEELVEQAKVAQSEAKFRDDAEMALVVREMAIEILALREELEEEHERRNILAQHALPRAELR